MQSLLLPAVLTVSLAMPMQAERHDLSALTKAMIVKAADLSEAVNAPGRPESATVLDESRKPLEVLGFLGLQQGMQVADLITGRGYWSEIIARFVGPKGGVTAFQPQQIYGEAVKGEWDALLARQKGIDLELYPFESFSAPADRFDFAIINLNYHDLYADLARFKVGQADPAAYVKALYAAMKPGGIVGVIDHVAPSGEVHEVATKYHRIDPAVVKADFEKAGFVLEATGDMLRNPEDDHLKPAHDPSIRGNTDRFAMKFRKPR